jgi:uncharacterized protein with PIN domain
MVKNILPKCDICDVPVTDLVEPEVKNEGQIKEGKYIDNVWICVDCMKKNRIIKKLSLMRKSFVPFVRALPYCWT